MKINNRECVYRIDKKDFHCAMDVTMSFIGGKWKTVVLWYLIGKTKRFGELKKMIPNITEKMLSLQLKALEKDGLVIRKVYAEVPPKVEYSLSEKGQGLIPILKEISKWGRHIGESDGKLVYLDAP